MIDINIVPGVIDFNLCRDQMLRHRKLLEDERRLDGRLQNKRLIAFLEGEISAFEHDWNQGSEALSALISEPAPPDNQET